MQLFIDGHEIPEPREGWSTFASKSFSERRHTAHPATEALRRTVMDLLGLMHEDVHPNILVQPALVRCSSGVPRQTF